MLIFSQNYKTKWKTKNYKAVIERINQYCPKYLVKAHPN